MALCVECEAEIDLDDPDVGEIVSCPECGIEMEVISARPLELEMVTEAEEEEAADDEEESDWQD